MTLGVVVALVLLLAGMVLVSYVERIYTEMGKFLSREFQENIEVFELAVEPRLGMGRPRAALSMAVLEQLLTAAVAALIAWRGLTTVPLTGSVVAETALLIVLLLVVFNQLTPFILFARTRGQWLKRLVWPLRLLIYAALPVTLVIGFVSSVTTLTREHSEPQPETPAEAVDALIEAGQEEGILEESDRDLIQSVVEFGDKTVREVMTARPDIFAVPAATTVEAFTEMLRIKPYSRVPVYEESIDRVLGIVFAHDVLQVPDVEARTRTVASLMKTDVRFVPETKRVHDLLRQMQKENIRMEIVVDEYGAVAGVVTIEDMVEEIVGEIRDEREKADIIREGEHSYVVPGTMDVDRLPELFGIRPEGREATTVAGLVSEIAGHIPQRGEVIRADGLCFEILDSTDRRVEKLRISLAQHAESKRMPA